MGSLYIFETRELDYLNAYVNKAKKVGYRPVVLSGKGLDDDARLAQFKGVYQHLSSNPYDFEFNCFARYFALANTDTGEGSFILSDSDIYITYKTIDLSAPSLQQTFVGSEGFHNGTSEWQISPHFSVWNEELVNNFVDYLLNVYKRNQQDEFLVKHYEEQKSRLGQTAISDMTLLYLWVKDNHIPYINSNNTNNDWGIDHNISALNCENNRYQSIHNRKKVEVTASGEVYCTLESGERQAMSCLHFQGAYKQALYDYYVGDYKKFDQFSVNNNLGQKVSSLAGHEKRSNYKFLAHDSVSIETAFDNYRAQLDLIPDEKWEVTPPGGGWSFSEIYSHILQATLGASIAAEKCTQSSCKPSTKGPTLFGRLLLLIGKFPPVNVNVPPTAPDRLSVLKISKEEARNLLIKCRKRMDVIMPLIYKAPKNARITHPRLGMLNARQWLKFIRIHLNHHLKQIQRTENKFLNA